MMSVDGKYDVCYSKGVWEIGELTQAKRVGGLVLGGVVERSQV